MSQHSAMRILLLSPFSRVRLCATPSLGLSRQEHWSGLPFPSPMHKSEKWKWSRSAVSDSLSPHGRQPTRLLHPWDFPGKSTGVGCHCLLGFKKFQTTVITDKSNMKCFIEKTTTQVSNITTAMSDHLQYEIIFILVLKIKNNFKISFN